MVSDCGLVLIVIYLMNNELEHLFMYLLVICISSLEKCQFKLFAHFFNWVVCPFVVELLFFIYCGC